MKKVTLFTIMILSLALTACGAKEDEERQTPQEVQNEVATNNSVSEEAPEEILEEPTEENENHVEEVIGDVDVAANELTMNDMQEQELGMDIPVYVAEEGSEIAYENKFMVLFPSPMYVTEVTDKGARAQLETIDIQIGTTVSIANAPNKINENRGETMETIGDYIVVYTPGRNDDLGTQKSYRVYDTANGTLMQITLTINKVDGYVDYANALVEEYIPAFEEVLLANLQ